MIQAWKKPRNRTVTLILLFVCASLAVIAAILGVDDNPPGILAAFLAAIAFILTFAHPWRTARKFLFLLLAAVLGVVLFVTVNIITDTIAQNQASSGGIQELLDSPAYEFLSAVFAMLLPAAFLVGLAGSIGMFIRNRRRTR